MGREEREGRGGDGTGGPRKEGGAEAYARYKQYDYKAVRACCTVSGRVSSLRSHICRRRLYHRCQNSTLVLTADNRSRDPKEPDGTAGTLWGKIDPKSFGDRVVFSKPSEGDDKKKCVLHTRNAAASTLSY